MQFAGKLQVADVLQGKWVFSGYFLATTELTNPHQPLSRFIISLILSKAGWLKLETDDATTAN